MIKLDSHQTMLPKPINLTISSNLMCFFSQAASYCYVPAHFNVQLDALLPYESV